MVKDWTNAGIIALLTGILFVLLFIAYQLRPPPAQRMPTPLPLMAMEL